ncbi:MoxR family ATPase [Streptomyces sp. ODS28]|uniref:AAA family ATPase n=1 Tax=Streptomyces sp. ODS28 TaxID=3136688 RepID=UPI0031EF3DE1
MSQWLIYKGAGEPHDGIDALPPPPPWRTFDGLSGVPDDAVPTVPDMDPGATRRRGQTRVRIGAEDDHELELINAALYLRRPLLVTGVPGSGKSTLAHSLAYELKLGRVLQWPVLSRTTLRDGLYQYDAIGRLQDAQLPEGAAGHDGGAGHGAGGIGRYVRLGPLGTALLPTRRPRVLLVDELDKSDIDLPNDLLNVLEEGEYEIPELSRLADEDGQDAVRVRTDDGTPVTVRRGRVRCQAFPIVIMTSNGERDFPLPLLRRCIHLDLKVPDRDRLAAMVQAHFGEVSDESSAIIDQFLSSPPGELRAADQLLNAIYLTQRSVLGGDAADPDGKRRLAARLMGPLGAQSGAGDFGGGAG